MSEKWDRIANRICIGIVAASAAYMIWQLFLR